MTTLLDKNNLEINEGETVKYVSKSYGVEENGLVRIESWDGETLMVVQWLEPFFCYAGEATQWEVTKNEYGFSTTIKNESQEGWFEKEFGSATLDTPPDKWIPALSTIVENYIKEEGIVFSLRENQLQIEHLSDNNGFLGTFMYLADKKVKEVFGNDKLLPAVYYANKNALVQLSFDFDPEISHHYNTLFIYSHLLLEVLEEIKEKYEKNPNLKVNDMIPIDSFVHEWILSSREGKFKVLPYRPDFTYSTTKISFTNKGQ